MRAPHGNWLNWLRRMSREPQASLDDRFGLLISSIAGRRIPLQLTEDMGFSHFDGRCIRIPASLSTQPTTLFCAVIAQALLLGVGALRPAPMRRLLGRPVHAQSYLCLELRRGLSIHGEILPGAFTRHPALTAVRGWPLTRSVEHSLSFARSWRAPGDIPDFFGGVRPMLVLRHSATGDSAVGATQNDVAQALANAEGVEDQDDDQQDAETSQLLERLKSALNNGNPMSDALARLFGQSNSRSSNDSATGGDAEVPVGRVQQVFKRGIHAVRAWLPKGLPGLDPPQEANPFSRRYREWDCRSSRYRSDWVQVDETEPWQEDESRDFKLELAAPGLPLRRGLSQLGLEFQMHRRQRDGSEFDVGEMIEHAIELRCGHTPGNLDIYRASRKTRRDLGVVIVIDISGSSAEEGGDGNLVFRQQLQAGWQLGTTLDALGDCVALYGFRSWGREGANMVRLKGPEERWSSRVAERFSRLQPSGFSRLGAAVRHADHVLRESIRLPNRLLILISDGFAYDQEYEQEYAHQDTAMALRESQESGTACVCLTVSGSTPAAQLEATLGSASRLVVDDAWQWQARVGPVCRQALISVRTAHAKSAARGVEQRAF